MTVQFIDERHAASEPSWSCGLSGAYLGALGFNNGSLLVHGSSGCGFAMRYGLSPHWKSFIPCPVTSFGEDDVIFGGANLLERGIAKARTVNPSDALFVLSACSTEIIGEDIQGAATEASRRYGVPVVGVDSGGATGNTLDGYNSFLLRCTETLYPPATKVAPAGTQVDVMGIIPYYDMFWRGDIKEIKRLLGRIGIQVNSTLSGDCSLETVARANETALTVTLCRHIGQRALMRIKNNRRGNIHVCGVAPIGLEFTRRFLEELVERLPVDRQAARAALDEEEETARKVMLRGFDFAKVMFNSGRAAVIGEASRVIGLTNLLCNELGMRALLVAFTNKPDPTELKLLDEVLARRGNQTRVLIDQSGEVVRQHLAEVKPNIVFGRSTDRIAELDKTAFITWQFPSTDRLVVYDRPYLGFRGLTAIVDDIINGFSRIWY